MHKSHKRSEEHKSSGSRHGVMSSRGRAMRAVGTTRTAIAARNEAARKQKVKDRASGREISRARAGPLPSQFFFPGGAGRLDRRNLALLFFCYNIDLLKGGGYCNGLSPMVARLALSPYVPAWRAGDPSKSEINGVELGSLKAPRALLFLFSFLFLL